MTSAVQPPGEPSDGASLTFKSKSIRLEHVGRRMRIGWALVALSALLMLSAVMLWMVGNSPRGWKPLMESGFQGWALLGCSMLALAGSVAWISNVRRPLGPRRGARGRITVEGDAIVLERRSSQERMARSRVTGGWREQGPTGRPIAVIQLEDEVLLGIEVRNADAAARVLRAAGADARAVAMRIGGREGELPWILAAFFALSVFPLPAFVTWSIMPVFACVLVTRALRTTVIIGTDGVTVQPPLGSRRYVPYAEIEGVHVHFDVKELPSVVLYRHRGEPIKVFEKDTAVCTAVVERIREAMAASAVEPAHAEVLSALDRGARPLEAWREHLRSLLRQSAAYRSRALKPEDVATVVEDPRAEPVQRVAAAAALASTGDPEVTRRVRIAASACADEHLRIALDQAAEGELDDSLLAELETRAERRAR